MAYVLEAAARDALGDQAAADSALEHALDLAEPDGALTPFLLSPSPGLLDRHARHRTAHASLLAEIRAMLDGTQPAPPPAGPRPLPEPLSGSEIRVLRYLPTHLNTPEIARELYVSRTPCKPTSATSTPSSAPTAGPRPSSAPAPWACSPPPARAGPAATPAPPPTSL